MDITRTDVDSLLERFYNFDDGVVEDLLLTMRAEKKTCIVKLLSFDRTSTTKWSRVTLTLHDVSEFRFEYGRSTFEVLSGGIQIGWRDDRIFLVLDAYPDDGGDLPNLDKNTAYVAARSCCWHATEYHLTE